MVVFKSWRNSGKHSKVLFKTINRAGSVQEKKLPRLQSFYH
jgi:hypothetical protein